MNKNFPLKNIVLALLFSILLSYFEASVVVYLRGIYYPEGFSFPLIKIRSLHFFTELVREIVALLLILLFSLQLGKGSWKKTLFYFLFIFGVWDIFYYFWLFVILGWPDSLLTWDVLYLIPVPWVAPVLAPILVSLLFTSTIVFIIALEKGKKVFIPRLERSFSYIGFLFIFVSFIEDTASVVLKKGFEGIMNYYPQKFNWFLFLVGYLLLLFSFVRMVRRIQ
jgi:hypothetical protein